MWQLPFSLQWHFFSITNRAVAFSPVVCQSLWWLLYLRQKSPPPPVAPDLYRSAECAVCSDVCLASLCWKKSHTRTMYTCSACSNAAASNSHVQQKYSRIIPAVSCWTFCPGHCSLQNLQVWSVKHDYDLQNMLDRSTGTRSTKCDSRSKGTWGTNVFPDQGHKKSQECTASCPVEMTPAPPPPSCPELLGWEIPLAWLAGCVTSITDSEHERTICQPVSFPQHRGWALAN